MQDYWCVILLRLASVVAQGLSLVNLVYIAYTDFRYYTVRLGNVLLVAVQSVFLIVYFDIKTPAGLVMAVIAKFYSIKFADFVMIIAYSSILDWKIFPLGILIILLTSLAFALRDRRVPFCSVVAINYIIYLLAMNFCC